MSPVLDITDVVQKKINDLPPLPLVVRRLMATLADDKSSADDVMKVISADQALAGKVLRLVNSSFYGVSGQVSTLSRAVVVLGHAAIRNLAVGINVASYLSDAASRDQFEGFWDHSISAAAACRVLAGRTNYPDPEEAFIAGLLHDVGQLVLGIAVPQEYRRVLAGGPDSILADEQAIIGVGHNKVGQMLLKHWRLPKPLLDAVRFHHNPQVCGKGDDPLVSLVALADVFANVCGRTYERPVTSAEFVALVAATGFDIEQTAATLAEIDRQILETRNFLQIATDAEIPTIPTCPVEGARVVMICTDKTKMTWTRQVLGHFGVEMVAMKAFFGGDGDVDCVILDPTSLKAGQLEKMKPLLVRSGLPLLVFDEDADGVIAAQLGPDLPVLPLVFSRADLDLDS